MPKLRFPLDDQDQYPATIKFQVYVTDPPKIEFVKTSAKNNSYSSSDTAQITSGFAGANQDRFSQSSHNKNTALRQATDTARAAAKNLKSVKQSRPRSTPNTVTLYMPQAVQINDGVAYEGAELGVFGAGMEAGLKAGTDGIANAIADGIGSGISDLSKLITGSANQQSARIIAARFAPGAAVGGAVRSAFQTTPNPNARILFKSVNIREFSFTFKLIPKSIEESNEITRIIKFFRTELYPEAIKEGGINVAYKFPNKMKVILLYNGIEYKEKALSFEFMYLKAFNAVYNPTQSSFFRGGRFSEVDISLTMAEDRTLDKSDVDEEIEFSGGSN